MPDVSVPQRPDLEEQASTAVPSPQERADGIRHPRVPSAHEPALEPPRSRRGVREAGAGPQAPSRTAPAVSTPVGGRGTPRTSGPTDPGAGPDSSSPTVMRNAGGAVGAREVDPAPSRRTAAAGSPSDTSTAGGGRSHDAPPAGPRSWEVALPPGLEVLSLNGREHYMARHRTFQTLKNAAWAMLKNARIPRLERVTVRVVYDPPDRRPRDPDNLGPTVKPLVDAIVAAGILPSDTSAHVLWAHAEIGLDMRKPSRLRIIITEALPGGGEAA